MHDISVAVPGGHINVWHRPAQGEGSTVVLVHGLSGTSRWWSRVIDHLPPETGVAALDVRGRGHSLEAPAPFDLTTLADDIAHTLTHLEIDRTIVAGYSMGAWIVSIFGIRNPDRVDRLVLVDGGLPIPSQPGADPDEVVAAVVGPALARLEIEFADEDQYFDYWKSHPALQNHWDDSMSRSLGYELSPVEGGFRVFANPDAIRINAYQITVDEETNSVAAAVEVPSHLIVVERGTADQLGGMIPRKAAEAAANANPQLTMEYLPGLNHYTLVLGSGAPLVAAAIAPG
jgi:pimeloyl-ACP methyl ester carboxylesterase